MFWKPLSLQQLNAIRAYKYHCIDRSILSKALSFFWYWLVEFIPLSVSANAVSLIGALSAVLPCIALALSSPDANNDNVPRWLLFAGAVGIFLFQTCDNIDGKHARRTKSSSALGELFDHTCDGMSNPATIMMFFIAMRFGVNLDLLFVAGLLNPLFEYSFYWRAHYSGMTYILSEFSSVEVQWTYIIFVCLSAWTQNTAALFQGNFLLIPIVFYFGYSAYALTDVWITSIRHIFNLFRVESSQEKETSARAVSAMVPVAITIILAVLSRYLGNGIYERYPLGFLTVYIFAVGKLSCRVVMLNMSNSRVSSPFNSAMFAFIPFFLTNSSIAPSILLMTPQTALCFALAYAIVDYFAQFICGLKLVANFLKIDIFTMKRPLPSD